MSEQAAQAQPSEIAKRVEQFIKLRDKIAEIKKEQEAVLKPYTETLLKLNTLLLELVAAAGVDSVKINGVGTVFKTVKDSATVADGAEFRRFVIGSEAWDIIDWRANAPGVRAYMEENEGAVPPGINFRRNASINVRRASSDD